MPALMLCPSRAPDLGWLLVLVVAAVVGQAREIKLANGVGLDATTAAGLVGLALWGPLPALLVVGSSTALCSGVLWRFSALGIERRGSLVRVGNLSNLASLGWSLLAGGAVLDATAAGHTWAALPAVCAAGVAASWSQLALGPCIHETLWVGYRPSEVLRPAVAAALADLAMIALGALTWLLAGTLGIWALLLLATTVLLLALVPAHVRARSVHQLARPVATELYALELARCVGVDARSRRDIPGILDLLEHIRTTGLLADIEQSQVLDGRTLKLLLRRYPAAFAAWTTSENWDGSGPTRLRTEQLPRLASVIAVAEEWASLTCAGGAELSHEQALVLLGARAGTRHDPHIVRAAHTIVQRQQRFHRDSAFRPKASQPLRVRCEELRCRLLSATSA